MYINAKPSLSIRRILSIISIYTFDRLLHSWFPFLIQVTPGSITALGLFGKNNVVDEVTGDLPLMD